MCRGVRCKQLNIVASPLTACSELFKHGPLRKPICPDICWNRITVYAAVVVIVKEYLLKCTDDVVLQLVHNDAKTKLKLLP